jgi:hypothetical protein
MFPGMISFENAAIEIEATVIAEALDLNPEVVMSLVRSDHESLRTGR